MRGPQPFYAVDPAVAVVAHEYRHIGFMRRLVLRWVSPDLARAAAHMASGTRPQQQQKPGPLTRRFG